MVIYSRNISWQDINNVIYIFNEINNKMCYLEDVSRQIWLMINRKMSIESMINNLSETYNQSLDLIQEDLLLFLQELKEMELINYGFSK